MKEKHSKGKGSKPTQAGKELTGPALDADLTREPTPSSVSAQPPVEAQPRKRIMSWSVYRATPKDGKSNELFGMHFVGRDLANGGGCVSGRIASFDPQTMSGIGSSGQLYELVSFPGINLYAERALNEWIASNKVDVAEATEEFMKTYGLTREGIAKREWLRCH